MIVNLTGILLYEVGTVSVITLRTKRSANLAVFLKLLIGGDSELN
jgi:hypothetical protein